MPAIILIGDKTSRQTEIDSFIRSENIPLYNIRTYETILKISDVRDLIHYISFKDSSHAKRVILIHDSITHEAQNAFLKTLEELPEDVYIFLSASSLDQFLPTVISRCMIKRLKIKSVNEPVDQSANELVFQLLSSFSQSDVDKQLTAVLLLGEFVESREDGYRLVISALHEQIRKQADGKDYTTLSTILIVTKLLNSNFWFVKNNNGNSRMVLESVLLGTIVRK